MPNSKRTRHAETLDQAFRAVLKDLREAKGWTQADLAAISGYRQSFISNIETGRQTPRINVVFNLLEALEKRPDLYMRTVWMRVDSKPSRAPRRHHSESAGKSNAETKSTIIDISRKGHRSKVTSVQF
jgi:transcriptional regulator with XRE-family HTH domain